MTFPKETAGCYIKNSYQLSHSFRNQAPSLIAHNFFLSVKKNVKDSSALLRHSIMEEFVSVCRKNCKF